MSIAKVAVPFFAVTASIFVFGPEIGRMLTPEPLVVERQVEKPKKSIEQIVFEASQRYRVPAMLIRAVIRVESAGDPSALRHEPHHLSRIRWENNPEQKRMWASSIGLMQVMAWHLQRVKPGASYALLFEPEVNVHLGTKILADCMERHRSSSRLHTVRRALVCYNGSEVYPDKVLRELASEVVEEAL